MKNPNITVGINQTTYYRLREHLEKKYGYYHGHMSPLISKLINKWLDEHKIDS